MQLEGTALKSLRNCFEQKTRRKPGDDFGELQTKYAVDSQYNRKHSFQRVGATAGTNRTKQIIGETQQQRREKRKDIVCCR